MSNEIIVHKGRRNTLQIGLGYDVSGDVITSQIRVAPEQDAPLIAEWSVSFLTNGVDGELVLVLDDSITSLTEQDRGFMDLKRLSGGEPLSVFDKPLEVVFRGTVTA